MEKLMIVGGSGLLGGHLAKQAKDEFEVVATFKNHSFEMKGCRRIYMDITEPEKTKDIIMKENPDTIILAAAQRDVDFCERNKAVATRINVEGAKNVALASKRVHAKLVYLSTDLVFDGSKGLYQEDDVPNPMNHYGFTKLEGEHEVENSQDDFAIARVSVLYGWNLFDHTINFVTWIYNGLSEGKRLGLFTDQFRNATYINSACEALLSIHKRDEKGVFHVVGKNCVNRHHIGLKIAETFGFDKDLITASTSDEGDWQAIRPKKCCLDPDKMERILNVKSMSIGEGLSAMKAQVEDMKGI
ncbi:MAG: SDR family oxidoreductase [Thermoplasmata archaeon]|nr:MAG: SDR family oxidoreductase [Thermoplasmata archaeon]